ncbi:MAG: hypothetical protein KDA89_20995, partial [Planctomycetaceae bacterium]|nr:hypothetical protein [Planctomycetaceae bacterium]
MIFAGERARFGVPSNLNPLVVKNMISRRGSKSNVFAGMISDLKAAVGRGSRRRRVSRPAEKRTSGAECLETRLVLSALVVSSDVNSVGDVTLTATDEATTGDDLTIQAGVTVESTGGQVTLNVGDDLLVEAGASVLSSQAIVINLDSVDADPGVGSTATIDGTVSAGVFSQINTTSDGPINVTIGSAARKAAWEIHGGTGGDDTLTVNLEGLNFPVFSATGPGQGSITDAGESIGIEFFDIENINTVGGGFAEFHLDTSGVSDGSDDSVTLVLDGTGNDVIIQRNGTEIDRMPISVGRLTITGSDDNDTLVIDHSAGIIGADITFNGGNGNDSLVVIGNGSTNGTYTPGATGAGTVDVDGGGGTITFTGLEPVDISGMATATLSLPGANDVLTIADGTDFATGTTAALRVSGTSGGTTIETAAFFNNGNLIIDTSDVDGTDTITVTSASGSHANGNLTVATGGTAADGDQILLNGSVTTTGTQTY